MAYPSVGWNASFLFPLRLALEAPPAPAPAPAPAPPPPPPPEMPLCCAGAMEEPVLELTPLSLLLLLLLLLLLGLAFLFFMAADLGAMGFVLVVVVELGGMITVRAAMSMKKALSPILFSEKRNFSERCPFLSFTL